MLKLARVGQVWRSGGLASKFAVRGMSFNARDHAFHLLGLKTFSDAEIQRSYESLGGRMDGTVLDIPVAVEKLGKVYPTGEMDAATVRQVNRLLVGRRWGGEGGDRSDSVDPALSKRMSMDQTAYRKCVLALGEKLDPRVWGIGLSFLFAGISVGIIIPCMPLLVSQLDIPPMEFGLVISAFGLSKLIGNIPSGYLVETYGRKPVIVGGMTVCGVGLGSLAFALVPGFGTPWLIGCRFLTGLGKSAFLSAGYLFMSDISNPLNRTRTIAPVLAAFSGGIALGPAVGGVLIDTIGISQTYGMVGVLYVSLAAMNSFFLAETKELTKHAGGASRYNPEGHPLHAKEEAWEVSHSHPDPHPHTHVHLAALQQTQQTPLMLQHPQALHTLQEQSPHSTHSTHSTYSTYSTHSTHSPHSTHSSHSSSHNLHSSHSSHSPHSSQSSQSSQNSQESSAEQPRSLASGFARSFTVAYTAWMGLLSQNPQLRQTVGLNGMFWFTMSGTQMTLLPLLMVSPAYNLSSYEIGGSFALMSLISFLAAQPLAAIADKYGKVPSIMAGCTMLAGSMAGIPYAKEITSGAVTTAGDALASLGAEVGSEALLLSMADTSSALLLVPVLVPLAMGNIVMNAVPAALISDLTLPSDRAQGLSLLRASGDLGYMLGASFSGVLATVTCIDTALQLNGALAAAGMSYFAFKNLPLMYRAKP